MVRTVSPNATDTPSSPMPTPGKAAASTALPQPPSTSQNVPMNSATIRTLNVISHLRAHAGAEAWFRQWDLGLTSDDIEVLDALGQVLVLRLLAVQLDVEAHFVGGVGEAQGVLVADAAGLVEVEQRLVEGLHAELPRLLHDLLDLVDLALEDQVGDQRRVEQHLDRRGAALAFAQRDQALRDDRLEVERQVHQQLLAPLL